MLAKLKARVCKKLRGKRGESIAETLIGLLISSLALVMLAGAVSSAANIVTRSRTSMIEYYQTNDAARINAQKSAWSDLIEEALK